MKPLLILGPSGKSSGRKKSVCLFSLFIAMLIIRNWRRCILVCMEFEVFLPPVTFHHQFIENGTKANVGFYETMMKT